MSSSKYPALPTSDPSPNPTEETRKKRIEFWQRLCDAVREREATPRDPFEALKGWNVSASKRVIKGNNSRHYDAYYFDEDGNRYRSKPEVFKFLDSGIKGKPSVKEETTTKKTKSSAPTTNADAARKKEKGKNEEGKKADEDWVETREKETHTMSLQGNRLKRKTSEAREEWAKLPIASSAIGLARPHDAYQQQQQQQGGHSSLKKPRIIEQRQMVQEQQQPKVTRRHDCKNFFNVVSSQEKLDLIRMVTGATVTVDAKTPTGLVVEGTEQEVRRGVNKINEMIENTRERNRLLSERATKQSMKPLNVMSIISAVKGEDKDNSIRPPTSLHSMNSNGTHISPPNGKSMSASPTTLADAFVPEAVRFGSDAFINKVRTSIRENKMFSEVSSTGREAYRFVKKHGDVGADKIFEGLKELADENVETDAVIAGGSGVGDDNDDDSETKLEIERKIVPLALCSAIMKAAIEDVHSSEGGSSDILAVAVKAKGFVVENIQKYLRPMLRGIMRGESQLSQDINLRKRAYDIAKKTQLKCIAFLDEWSNNTNFGDLSKHETIQPAKDVLSELRRRAKDRIEGKHRRPSVGTGTTGAYQSTGHRLIDRVQRPEAKIKIDSDLSIAMKKSTGENGDEEDHHEDLAFSLENQYGGFAGAPTQLGDFSMLRSDLSLSHLEVGEQQQQQKVSEAAAPPPETFAPPRRDPTPEPPSSQAPFDVVEEGEVQRGATEEVPSEWD